MADSAAHRFGRRALAEHHLGGVAGQDVEDGEDDDRRRQERQQQAREALEEKEADGAGSARRGSYDGAKPPARRRSSPCLQPTFPDSVRPTDRVLVGGAWRAAAGGATLALEDPSDGSELARIARGGAADIDAAVAAARAALEARDGAAGGASAPSSAAASWRRSARRCSSSVELLAALEAHDVGKPLKQARADAIALARYCEFYAGAADKVHGETLPFPNGYTALTLREPHGVTGHIVPWNYPMQIVGRSVGAALAMGNACVLKPAEEACLTVLAFARIARRGRPAAGRAQRRHRPRRGSRRGARGASRRSTTSRSPARSRSARWSRPRPRSNAVPVTLELGGKSPQIVFADADLDAALPYPGQRRHPERRPDVLGGVAHPGRAAGLRARASTDGRALPGARASARRRATSTSAR